MWLFSRKGPSGFSPSSTAEEVTHGIDGTGLTAIVTGASSGIGTETARVLALRGVHVVMGVRNMAAGRDFTGISEEICIRFNSSGRPLNLLINNAGIMATPFKLSKDHIELHFATNHLGHFLLTNLLLDTMKKTARKSKREGRIVNVSSAAHHLTYSGGIRFDKINDQSGYSRFVAYGQSKLANVLHINELARRFKEEGVDITANSLHPGMIATNVARHMGVVNGIADKIGKLVLKSVEQGAATTCYVALHPQVKGVSGEYFVDSNIGKASKKGRDVDLAKKLWDFSMNMVK
ncbi:hypothetical protein SLA2020_059500 [Shorea laevis]